MVPAPSQKRVLALALILAGSMTAVGSAPRADEPETAQWQKYYERTSRRPPRPVLLDALQRFADEGRPVRRAVDAGCGSGIDTLHLLEQGIAVHAFDAEPAAIEQLRAAVPAALRSGFDAGGS